MEKFHIIVLSIATVALILILIFVGILLSKGDTNEAYPPSHGICPDYLEIHTDEATNKSKCIMYDESTETLKSEIVKTPGYSNEMSDNEVVQYIDFSNSGWKGECDKKKWANENGIVWDGISNYNSC